jgi:hypothetical protein
MGSQKFGPARFWESIAAVMMLIALENFTPLQRPFISRLAKYLGNVSFSLYIVQIPIFYSGAVWSLCGSFTQSTIYFGALFLQPVWWCQGLSGLQMSGGGLLIQRASSLRSGFGFGILCRRNSGILRYKSNVEICRSLNCSRLSICRHRKA